MTKLKRRGFTLIELIAVLVILAILALIVTPLVMNIIRKARISADKRSIDAYGRSIELAIASYLLDNGKFPTSIDELSIEYSEDKVVCSTTQLNSDSSVYLAGCTVAGRSTGDYTYGEDKTPPAPTYAAYQVGDQVTYNSINYYVIKDSDTAESTVTMLKAEPLTVDEVNTYGAGHVNMYVTPDTSLQWYQQAIEIEHNGTDTGIGGIAYYSSATCGYDSNNQWQYSGCTTDYAQSEIKYVVDAWKAAQAPNATNARLITLDDLIDNLGMEEKHNSTSYWIIVTEDTPAWVMGENYYYWTMTTNTDKTAHVWYVFTRVQGMSSETVTQFHSFAVRPVIVLPKSALQS